MVEKTKKGDFVEIKYTGIANGDIFDSNFEDELKKINPEAKPQKTVIVIGEKMVVDGLDNALRDKEIGKDYEVSFSAKEGFGERRRDFVKTIPLKAFTEHKMNPQAGMVLNLDNHLVKILVVSGARVIADFNNPLAGKNLTYKFKIVKVVEDLKEKTESLLSYFFRFIPDFEVGEKIVVKGPKTVGVLVDAFGKKFKELLGKELEFEEIKEKKGGEENVEEMAEIKKDAEKKEEVSQESS